MRLRFEARRKAKRTAQWLRDEKRMPLSEIVAELAARGLVSERGKPFGEQTVKTMLRANLPPERALTPEEEAEICATAGAGHAQVYLARAYGVWADDD